jgi:hypothetical protein
MTMKRRITKDSRGRDLPTGWPILQEYGPPMSKADIALWEEAYLQNAEREMGIKFSRRDRKKSLGEANAAWVVKCFAAALMKSEGGASDARAEKFSRKFIRDRQAKGEDNRKVAAEIFRAAAPGLRGLTGGLT